MPITLDIIIAHTTSCRQCRAIASIDWKALKRRRPWCSVERAMSQAWNRDLDKPMAPRR